MAGVSTKTRPITIRVPVDMLPRWETSARLLGLSLPAWVIGRVERPDGVEAVSSVSVPPPSGGGIVMGSVVRGPRVAVAPNFKASHRVALGKMREDV